MTFADIVRDARHALPGVRLRPATVLALHARLAPALSSRRATVRPRNLMKPPGVRIRRVRPGVVAPTGYRASGACGTMPG